jgi:hypothetical protein
MKLQEAVKVYQECHSKGKDDCDTCPINQRDYPHQLTTCNYLSMAEGIARKINTVCNQVDCQERNNKNACGDCVEGHLYQLPDAPERGDR